jgi:hypothetical protein
LLRVHEEQSQFQSSSELFAVPGIRRKIQELISSYSLQQEFAKLLKIVTESEESGEEEGKDQDSDSSDSS